jgi:putative flippase GtrA
MRQNTKDWIQYISAIALIASAIIMAFLCFMVINDITAGVNAYIGIAISCALAIFGVSAYMVNQVATFKTEMRKEVKNIIREEEERKHDNIDR